jgi:dTDP-4-amino-4,6-dideoxygalactose transaminase
MISVSRTKLPNIKKYNQYLKRIWKSNWLTNNGSLVQELEEKLQQYWKVKHVVCVDHGTSAIMIALKALDITKEVYLSANNFVATAAAPDWLGIKLKFLDLDEDYKSPAIVTHLYGEPNITNANPVIYDASHAFTTKYKGKSILNYGNVSAISFNAVKLFQSAEGGAVVTNDDKIAKKARYLRNFGFDSHYFKSGKKRYQIVSKGINCKMSEFHAAMGLSVLPIVDKMRKRYDKIISRYNKAFNYNYEQLIYYPIYYKSYGAAEKAIKEFEKYNIYPRRYFYPPLNKVFGGKSCPIAEDLMDRVLCLPLYHDLNIKDQDLVIKIAQKTL